VTVRLRSWYGQYIHRRSDGAVLQLAPGQSLGTDIWMLTRDPNQNVVIRTNDGGILTAETGFGGSVVIRQDTGTNSGTSWRGIKIKAVHLRSYFGNFLSISAHKGEILADEDKAADNETLTLERAPSGNGPGKAYYIKSYHGKYVTANPKKGHVDATAEQPKEWETWWFERKGEKRGIEGSVALRSYHGKYLCAEKGKKGTVVADRDTAQEWETWTIFAKDLTRGSQGGVRFCF